MSITVTPESLRTALHDHVGQALTLKEMNRVLAAAAVEPSAAGKKAVVVEAPSAVPPPVVYHVLFTSKDNVHSAAGVYITISMSTKIEFATDIAALRDAITARLGYTNLVIRSWTELKGTTRPGGATPTVIVDQHQAPQPTV